MSLKSAPSYWLECDAPGCMWRCPDDGSMEPTTSAILDHAEYAGWKVTDDARHYCHDHRFYICMLCGKYDPAPLPGDRDYLCTGCTEDEDV